MEVVYWDSDCFLGWLQAESGKEDLCEQVLAEADAGKLRIVTSSLTIAEVLALKHHLPLPLSIRERVEDFFKQPYIITRSVTRRTAENARGLVWDHGIKPKDAIHVATAIEAGISRLHTFDVGLIGKSAKVGEPALIIERPSVLAPRLPLRRSHREEAA